MVVALTKISPLDFKEKVHSNKNLQLIDVREPAEHASEYLEGSRNIPLSTLHENIASLDHARPVYLVCSTGNRAGQAAEKLSAAGFKAIFLVEGGLEGCKAAGVQVKQGHSKVWSIDRQVRFGSGALTLTGILLSFWLHPSWIALSLFVACGQIFSAVTHTCGMAMVLVKMPWNQRTIQRVSACSLKK